MKPDGGPVFPIFRGSRAFMESDAPGTQMTAEVDKRGMSTRDYFAAHAPAPPAWFEEEDPYNRRTDVEEMQERFIRWRWHYADAMLKEREKE